MQAETEYCKRVLADTEALQEALYRELRGRIQEADQSAPLRRAGPFSGATEWRRACEDLHGQ
jgi:oligopeptidase B